MRGEQEMDGGRNFADPGTDAERNGSRRRSGRARNLTRDAEETGRPYRSSREGTEWPEEREGGLGRSDRRRRTAPYPDAADRERAGYAAARHPEYPQGDGTATDRSSRSRYEAREAEETEGIGGYGRELQRHEKRRRRPEDFGYEETGDDDPGYEETGYEEDDHEDPEDESGYDGGRAKPKKKSAAFPLIVFLLILFVTLSAGAVFYLIMQRPEKKLPGVWQTQIDLTGQAMAEAAAWISAAEGGEEIDLSAIREIKLTVTLTMEADGTWSQRVDADSYAAASDAAYAALADAVRDLLLKRIEAAGREISDADAAEQLISETIGMSTEEYLRGYGPGLLPTEEELREQYDGSGTYTAEKDRLRRSSEAGGAPSGTVTAGEGSGSEEEYLISEDTLVITGEGYTEVYHRSDAVR